MNIVVDLWNDTASASSNLCQSVHIQTQCWLDSHDFFNELFDWIYSRDRKWESVIMLKQCCMCRWRFVASSKQCLQHHQESQNLMLIL